MADESKSTKERDTTEDALLVYAYNAVGAVPFEAVRALAARQYADLMKEEWPEKVAELLEQKTRALQ
jgi:hypothetical protein